MRSSVCNPEQCSDGAPSLLHILAIFLKIGGVGFGGGMAVIALMEREFVKKRKLLSLDEFVHGIGLGQILGSFAVNASFFIGYRLFGPAGGALAAAAFLLPSAVMVTALSELYFRYHSIPALQGAVAGLGPVVIALILSAAWSIGSRVLRSWQAVAIAVAALGAGAMKINSLWVLIAAGITGLVTAPPMTAAARPARRSPQLRSLGLAVLPAATTGGSALLWLGATFLKIGLVFFGGGFVLIPVLHHRLVTDLHWLNAREFIDGLAISNLTPGPIAVLATFAGYHLAGVAGAVVATGALLAPSIGLMYVLSREYERYHDDERARKFLAGINPAVMGLILSSALLLGPAALASWRAWVLSAAMLLLLRHLHWHPAALLAMGAAAGYAGLLP